jgi:NADH-quinone oxidoreductase subunit N
MPEQMTLEQLMAAHSITAIAPELALAISALVVLLAGAFLGDALQKRLLPLLAVFGVLATGAATVSLWNKNLFFGPAETAIYSADNFSLFFKILFLIGLAITIFISRRFLHAREGDEHSVAGEYYALLMMSTVGMMMVAGARDLLVVFLGIETMSIALYVLAGFARRNLKSNEAALKYLLLGGFSTGFLLYGIALVYFSTGSTLFPEIAKFLAGAGVQTASPFGVAVFYGGVAFLLIGFGFKAAAVPFHQWTPDVYEGAPTPVTAFMATGAKAAAFAAILRVFPGALGEMSVSSNWHHLVLVMAVLTMTVGNVVAIAQNSLKRMLAYSSIAHAGYLLIGVIACGAAVRNATQIGMADGVSRAYAGVLFYLLVYAVMTLGAFAVIVYLENQHEPRGELDAEDANLQVDDVKGLASRSPLAAAAMTVFLLSLAGIPPTAGFFGKFSIFLEAMHQGLIGLLIVGVLNSVISVYYYFRPIVAMYASDELSPGVGSTPGLSAAPSGEVVMARSGGLSIGVALAIALCAIGVLGMIALQVVVFPLVLNSVPLAAIPR